MNLSAVPVDQLYTQLQSSAEGLPEATAGKRVSKQMAQFKKESRFATDLRLLLRQFANPLVLLLVVAVILSAMLGESSDAYIMLFILLTTCLLSFWQESNAGRAVEQLRKMIEMKHTVLREGKPLQLPVEQVVPGDILLLDAGDIIPADCRIVESNELHVNESSLTGESYPVEKMAGVVPETAPLGKKSNTLWQGTNVVSGTAKALVVQTGSQTIFGQMAHSVSQTVETAFEKGIKRFGYLLLRITISLSLVILAGNLYFRKPFFDAVLFSLALAVGMAPELLPAIMTFAMSAGAKRMLKQRVIVKKLSSIFNFGEVNVLCTDKTGTITEGNVVVKDMVDLNGTSDDRIRVYAWLNASLQNGFTNPIDAAIASLPVEAQGYEKVNEIPYDFIRKRLSVAVKKNGLQFFVTKGALTNVLEACSEIEWAQGNSSPLDQPIRKDIENRFEAYSREGYRVLGIAYKPLRQDRITRDDEQQMTFLGFILLEDPLKESASASIERLNQLHIDVKVITGDNRFAALHTAQKINIQEPHILTGEQLNSLSPEALTVQAMKTHIFAEIEPHQKERIVKALQKSNMTVAYIGDGINDVAAIVAADVGISTSNASDVAKEAADFVLLEKDLSVLAEGIGEGRRSFANSMKYIFITTGATFGNMFSVAGASLILPFLPMLPKQILLTNLITDFPFLTIASDRVDSEQLSKPGRWDMKMITRFMVVFGLHSSLFDFITFFILYRYYHLSGASFQTGWFLESSVTEVLILFVVRTRKALFLSRPGKLLLAAGLMAIAVTWYLPFSSFAGLLGFSVAHAQQVMAIIGILLAYLITADLLKITFFRWMNR